MSMSDPLEPLIIDLLEFVDAKPRRYDEVMEAWRTSCPRLPVWEEAHDRRLVATEREAAGVIVRLTDRGRELLASRHAE